MGPRFASRIVGPVVASLVLFPLQAAATLGRVHDLQRHRDGGAGASSLALRSRRSPEARELLELGSAAAHAQSPSPGLATGAVIHFLFLAEGYLPHVGLWRLFLQNARPSAWRAWIHCTDPDGCRRQMLTSVLPGIYQVPTVPSIWCDDLVTPMAALLKVALEAQIAPPGAIEKFVFVSDTTIPVKPFSEVYPILTAEDQSDICVTPRPLWKNATIIKYTPGNYTARAPRILVSYSAHVGSPTIGVVHRSQNVTVLEVLPASEDDVVRARLEDPPGWVTLRQKGQLNFKKDEEGEPLTLVKHSQWVALNRAHAVSFVESWTPIAVGKEYFTLRVQGSRWEALGRNSVYVGTHAGEAHGAYCTDEFAIFGKLFGPFEPGESGEASFSGLGTISGEEPLAMYAQGRCRTLVAFRDYGEKGVQSEDFHQQLGPDVLSVLSAVELDADSKVSRSRRRSHPVDFIRLGNAGLQALRSSPYLFMRKFHPNGTMTDYEGIVLRESPDADASAVEMLRHY